MSRLIQGLRLKIKIIVLQEIGLILLGSKLVQRAPNPNILTWFIL